MQVDAVRVVARLGIEAALVRIEGIADRQPPEFGRPYVTRVPLPDADGDDLGGIRLPAVALPLGTYTGWNLRRPEVGAPDKLARWSGSFIPFAPTTAAQRASGDPRLSREARYTSRADYERRSAAAAAALVDQRFLLARDVPELTRHAGAFYERVRAHAPNHACGVARLPDRLRRLRPAAPRRAPR